MERKSLAHRTDSYKASHFKQFPPGTESTYYYIESRGGSDKLLWFGLQAIIKKVLNKVPTVEEIKDAAKFWKAHGLPFNEEGWLALSELGYYPLRIKAVPEGTVIDTKKVLCVIENLDKRFFWLPGWIETLLLQIWYPTTVSTKSFKCKKVIKKYLEKTGTPEDLNFKLHSFGYRGVSSEESAEMGGMAELVNFMGTDTVAGIFAAQYFYNTDNMLGFSIPAAEHSTMTAWGHEFEKEAYENMLNQFAKPGALVAVVSDSYDLTNAVENIWGKDLKEKVLASGSTIVVRPDSGEPADIVLRTVQQLDKLYGSTEKKGYLVLNPVVRVIQGDGIDDETTIENILKKLTDAGYSADNVAFGMGGGSLQQVNRDTLKFAMKLSAVKVNGVWRDAYKCPVDAPWKASKRGRFDDLDLETVYENGSFTNEVTFEEVRERAASFLD